MDTYEGWIQQADGSVRIVHVETDCLHVAYELVKAQTDPDEFVRAVVVDPIEKAVEGI